MIGSAIQAFDFLAYGTAAAIVFNKLFFPTIDATAGTIAVFGAFAAGFFARPVGGLSARGAISAIANDRTLSRICS